MKGRKQIEKESFVSCFLVSCLVRARFSKRCKKKTLCGNNGGAMDRVTDPIPLKELPKYFPVKFKVPTFYRTILQVM